MPNAIYENGDGGVEVDPTLASGLRGAHGWSMVTALIADGERRVRRVVDWTGGEGIKPDLGGYLGPLGLVTDIAEATDDRGTKGEDGDPGAPGPQGKSAYQIAVDNGFVGTELQWLNFYVNEIAEAATNEAIGARDVAVEKADIATNKAILTAADAVATAGYRDAAALSASAVGYFIHAAATNVPRGISNTVGTITPGAGGTTGTDLALAWTGGNFAVNPTGVFDVAGGVVTAVRITGRGRYIGAAPTAPTPSFAASVGLTGGAVALSVDFLPTSGETYWAASADGTEYQLYLNNSGAPSIVPGQTQRIMKPATQGAISSGAIGPGYVEQGKVKPAIQSQFNRANSLQRIQQQGAVQPVIAGRNGGVFLGIRLSDGKAVLPLASESIEIDPEDISIRKAIDRAVAIPGVGMRNYTGADTRKPIIAGRNGGVLVWLDTTSVPPKVTGAISVAEVQYQGLFPNDARGRVSDYAAIAEKSAQTLRFIRPVTDGNNYQHCAPGAREGYLTTAQYMQIDVYWNNRVTRVETYNTIGWILVDDAPVASFSSSFAPGTPGAQSYTFDLGSTAFKKVEILWPYGAGMELRQTRFSANAPIAIPDARPAKLLNVHGDSTTHGYSASSILTSWAYGTAVDLGRQLLNTGNGSNTAAAGQGAVVAQAIIDTGIADVKSVYSIGINDCISNRVPTVAFKTSVEGYLAGFRSKLPTASLLFCSAFYCPAHETAHSFPLQDYRDVMQAIVTASGDPNLTYANGKASMVNSSDRLAGDLTHPNNLGCSEIRPFMVSNL
ncbi:MULTISPECIES: hypothetical protein [unclassified Mesorhizobium]|uniref:hypothetical protein n=1 Tax=unclassified Mesorhizobium TaxID=325217 RepID=UPI000FD2ABCA|nr:MULTISPECIES: hypothetical protein [unclassified Mesorhizobium]RVB72131.1 hypothetical protein EN885_30255 [Mesorhizobium sp. M6A.T.Cr.TU.014.01.1.1]RWP96305.1 MAG: hypothetical protein EOR91_31345 [Mesorhizobium sp.]RWP96414.1 MAG: hypothetical protein EOR90_30000 [Mesorhizobium sp.]